MPHQLGGSAVYRLLVHGEDTVRVYGARSYSSLDAALGSVASAVQSGTRIPRAVWVQRGLSLELPTFDPHNIEPGKRGGWTNIDWETVEDIRGDLLEELFALPRPSEFDPETIPSFRSQRPAMLAGVATAFFAALGLFSLQANSGPDGWAAKANVSQVTELPFSNAWGSDADSDPPLDGPEPLVRDAKGPNDADTRPRNGRIPRLPTGF